MTKPRLQLLSATPLLLLAAAPVRADVWTPTAIPPTEVGGGRQNHTAVWTGREMIVWGGFFGSNGKASGGVYDPVANTWRPTTLDGAPTPHQGHTAVWAGDGVDRMIVFGGQFAPFNRDGGMYDPAADRWTRIEIDGDARQKIPPPPNVPSQRAYHGAVWTGKEMIVWGGHCISTCHRKDGAAYDPLTDTWRRIKTPPFLSGRKNPTALWTGKGMLIWGGSFQNRPLNDGGLYDPEADEWTPITLENAPPPRIGYTAVWTGKEMIVWGGQNVRADGRIYDPAADRWRPMSTSGLPVNARKQPLGRQFHSAVWTGQEMIMWGGQAPVGDPYRGARYHPGADQWLMIAKQDAPTSRIYFTAVWGGDAMIVWGGRGGPEKLGVTQTGGVYRPSCGVYVTEPRAGDRVDREVTFRLVTGVATADVREAQLVVDGKPWGDWRPLDGDAVKLDLTDQWTGAQTLQVKTRDADGNECLSSEIPVTVGPTIKVLRLIYDPVVDEAGGRTLRDVFSARYGWKDPIVELSDEYNEILLEASGQFAKYEMTETLAHPGHLRETNGYVSTSDHLFNMMANCGDRGDGQSVQGWQNFEGVPPGVQGGPGTSSGCPGDTVPDSGVPLGATAEEMVYAQSFRAWGIRLNKVQLGLAKAGSPSRRIRVSVRERLDGEDLWSSYIRPEEVQSNSLRSPTRVHVGLDNHNDGRDANGDGKDQDDDPRDHDEHDDDGDGSSRDLVGRDRNIDLPLRSDQLYYLVVTAASAEPPGPSAAEEPDRHNHYWLSTTTTETGLPPFTDEESKLFRGSSPYAKVDMSAKLAYSHMLDIKHLATEVNFTVKGADRTIAGHVREGVIDEVHLIRSPLHDTPESVMLGPGAFDVNWEPIDEGVDSGRAFVLMGFNYERHVALMLHSYGHRTERTMSRIYGGWNNDPYWKALPQELPMLTNWDRFTAFKGVVGSRAIPGCGSAHFPPNAAAEEYQYLESRAVNSLCHDWLTYPNLKETARRASADTWGRPTCAAVTPDRDDCFQREFFRWWYTHLPKADGTNDNEPQKRLNNWWRYIVEPDVYKNLQ